jgi:hypothetical protein
MGIIRIKKRESGYTLMSNNHLNNKKLSLKSKGLLSFMLSKPNSWDFSVMGLVSQLKESKTSVMSSINELIDLRYVKRLQNKVDGKFSTCDYDVYEVPYAQNPYADIPHAENVLQVNTDLSKELNKVIIDKETIAPNKNLAEIAVIDFKVIKSNQISIIDQIEESEKKLTEIYPTFNDFWELYDKKTSKPKSQIKWNKLNQKEKVFIMIYIPNYIKSQPNKKYRKDPITFLNNEGWNDEIIFTNETKEFTMNRQTEDVIKSNLTGW